MRSLPNGIEAVQVSNDNIPELKNFGVTVINSKHDWELNYIEYPMGMEAVYPGDWICRVKGVYFWLPDFAFNAIFGAEK